MIEEINNIYNIDIDKVGIEVKKMTEFNISDLPFNDDKIIEVLLPFIIPI